MEDGSAWCISPHGHSSRRCGFNGYGVTKWRIASRITERLVIFVDDMIRCSHKDYASLRGDMRIAAEELKSMLGPEARAVDKDELGMN